MTNSAPPVTFAELLENQALVESLHKNGILTPTPVQAAAVPKALSGVDLMVQAQTGSGKTLAFVLPIVSEILKSKEEHGTLALVIAPTRELALQTREVISRLTSEIEPCCIIGGNSIKAQIKELRIDPRIVIGTPGRILDLISQRELILRKCKQFVLDEADEMLSMGFVEEVREILKRLPKERQGMFFSATLSPRVTMLAQSFLRSPETITIVSTAETKPDITHYFANVIGGVTAKVQALCNIIETRNPQSAIVFCNTKSDTELVEVFLRRRGFDARRINSDLSQKERGIIMENLKSGELRLLIATDVAARGIDVDQLELVVNYAIHDEPETYVHRTGRTGRAGRSGTAISLVTPQDFGAFYGLRRKLPIEIKELKLPTAAEVDEARAAKALLAAAITEISA